MKSASFTPILEDQSEPSFYVPPSKEAGRCAEPGCACGNAPIPRGSGYLYIPAAVVGYRKDCRTPAELLYKLNESLASAGCFQGRDFDRSVMFPRLLCKAAAVRRLLILDVAALDAATWWETGRVPLRVTPRSCDR